VAYQKHRRSRLCESREKAREAEADLLTELRDEAEEAAQPVTLALVCEGYLLDLEARRKSSDTIVTARNAKARLADYFGPRMKEPLQITEADLYAYRVHRLRQWAKRGKERKPVAEIRGVKASTINRDLRTIRAALRRAVPDFKFPAGLFLKETRRASAGSTRSKRRRCPWAFGRPSGRRRSLRPSRSCVSRRSGSFAVSPCTWTRGFSRCRRRRPGPPWSC
jgi:hypothetical protein